VIFRSKLILNHPSKEKKKKKGMRFEKEMRERGRKGLLQFEVT